MRVKKKHVWLGFIGSLIAGRLIVFGIGWNTGYLVTRFNITSESCDQIRVGMTERQVESILGKPADHEYHPWDISVYLAPALGTEPEWEKIWIGQDKAQIFVHFDAQGRVCNKAFSLTWGE